MSTTSPVKIKAVVFDLFSTLTSLSQLPEAPGRNAHEILGVEREKWLEAIFNDSRERLVGIINKPVDIIRDIAWKSIRTSAKRYWKRQPGRGAYVFATALENPPAGVIPALRKIREAGYRLALVSNADAVEIEGWHGSELGSLFDHALFSCHEGYMKPEQEIFQLCLDKLDLPAEECLYVGDGGNDELIASAEGGNARGPDQSVPQDLLARENRRKKENRQLPYRKPG